MIKYTLLLWFFKPKEKKALDTVIATSKKNQWLLKLKYYPVLYYKPEVFHIQWAKSIKDWMWVQDFGITLVVSLRGTHMTISPNVSSYWADLYLKLFPKVEGFHAVSYSLAKDLLKYGAKKEVVWVVKSGVDTKSLNYIEKTKISKPLRILSVGRSHFAKGYKYALCSMFALKQMGVHFHYTIIGIADNEALLFQRTQLGLENEVSFIDKKPFKEVKEVIQKADVLLLSSVEEGIANVVLEAMALGALVVSTDCGGMAEVVIPNHTGFLVPIRDPEAIAQALKTVSELPLETYQKITKQAREFIEEYHNEDLMVLGMQGLYDDVISE
jgi:colanic acid/amylovoran biosynthesis glycosyltransferase